jgi:hypothetical protein
MKEPKSYLLLLIFIFLTSKIYGQTDTRNSIDSTKVQNLHNKNLTLISGYQIHKNHFAEIGIGVKKDKIIGHHRSTIIYAISNELKLNDDFIWGLKAGLWIGGGSSGLNLGLNIINYTDFTKNALRFRPEIGIGFGVFRVVYGYNLVLTNKDFDGINKHNFALNIMFDVKKLN